MAEDDIKDAITRQAQRLGTKQNARRFYSPDELTSRASTTELNETLDKLEKTQYSSENYKKVSHLLLATNMISVGIDVARLNVMLLVGQPKLTSEYIQASSRVGRSLVWLLQCMMRPRAEIARILSNSSNITNLSIDMLSRQAQLRFPNRHAIGR